MAYSWIAQETERFDPYLNWRALQHGNAQIRPAVEPWCLVRIELPQSTTNGRLAVLHDALLHRRMPDDPKGISTTLLAAADEVRHVLQLKDDPFTDFPASSAREFYVYRPESLVHANGGFRTSEHYKILHAGPPIEGGVFTSQRSGYAPSIFPAHTMALTSEVAIGIIDDGIGFANERFRDRRGHSRVQRIWLQDIGRTEKSVGVVVGRVLERNDINKLLQAHAGNEQAIYAEVAGAGHDKPGHKPLAFRRSHGTFCLDVAAGYDPQKAPDTRPIFAVQLPVDAIADSSGSTVGNYVLQGVRQIMRWADAYKPGIPLVINFSYGILAGPKDGSHDIEQALAAMVRHRNEAGAKTQMVLAAGNSFNARSNAAFRLKAGREDTLDWIVLPDDGTPSFVEIWLDGKAALASGSQISVSLTPPGGLDAGKLLLDHSQDLVLQNGAVPIAGMNVRHGLGKSGKRTRVFLSISPTAASPDADGSADAVFAPPGRWQISISNGTAAVLDARLYIQRDGTPAGYPRRGRQSRFDHETAYGRNPDTGNYTRSENGPLATSDSLSAIATGSDVVVVGAAATAPNPDGFSAASYTASGPTLGRTGPDFSAFADVGPANSGILASGTFSGSVVAMNGTSVAAPQIVRFLADQLAVNIPGVFAHAKTAAPSSLQFMTKVSDQQRLGIALLPPDRKAMRNLGRYWP